MLIYTVSILAVHYMLDRSAEIGIDSDSRPLARGFRASGAGSEHASRAARTARMGYHRP